MGVSRVQAGSILLYDAGGRLLFRGGVTSARGHNVDLDRITDCGDLTGRRVLIVDDNATNRKRSWSQDPFDACEKRRGIDTAILAGGPGV